MLALQSVPIQRYQQLVKSGIEEICLVLGSEDERLLYRDFFENPLPEEHLRKLNPEMQEYENRILAIGKKLHYVYQKEKRGFGHAVYQAADFANNEPVLLMLGDTLYRSETGKPCALQLIEKYMSVFGQYILTPEVFEQLRQDINESTDPYKEIELTSALEKVRQREGMIGVQLQGRMFDMGNFNAYRNCAKDFTNI